MNYLIFCSFEVGGLIFKMAQTLNYHGIKAYYISLAQIPCGNYNSTEFHYGKRQEAWDLSPLFFKNENRLNESVKILRRIKKDYGITACLATGHKSYLLKEAGIKYKYWTYGADLYHYNNPSIILAGLPAWKKVMLSPYVLLGYARQQKKSILYASSMWLEFHQLKVHQRLYPKKPVFFLPRVVKTADYRQLCREKAESKNMVCRATGAKQFFFSSTRHFWAGNNNRLVDCKANDVIVNAFARYLEISNDKSTRLILVKRGPDASQSEQLARKLGIDGFVVWINEVKRDDLRAYYQGASACLGQFGAPILAYTALEPLACATPTASFFEYNNALVPFYITPPPVFNCKEPAVIAEFMRKMVSEPDYASRLSYDSWSWAKENCSEEKFVESFVKEMDLE